MKFARFTANTAGRDMVIGDLHGHIDDLARLLKKASFNPAVDRVFCTGDLVDRGPSSLDCLALLKAPWFHSIQGNHDKALVATLLDLIDIGPARVRETIKEMEGHLNENENGAGWIVRSFLRSPGARHWSGVMRLINEMPNLIIVGEGDNRYHVVHGALFLGQTVLDDATIDNLEIYVRDGKFSREALDTMSNDITWHRGIAQLIQEGWRCDKLHEGLSITYCGHNIVDKPALALSHYHLDTGSGWQRPGQKNLGLTLAILENGFPVSTLTTKETSA